ncbi:hypothetical protein [Flagellimonas zhangzhouensis]|uniref:Lipocalin-like domain-containing protein n=1 Tax=Flagellimonas zhangzhouensis TaxID=1073328 RepID=A0A1H2QHP6_9FLAO|nr:hypothetical protein [Allomuricauda zhangzhouensis]SDQ53022.1 hypothetical protein SAMN05216294_1570 [Allomuricauda zhangzhouensis]SDW06388.1 hypothetical protein SAMN04487892_0221 [Allomuricauda zhangzhouensis]
MKKLFSLLSIIAILAVSNCSEIPENNDPILGIWAKTEISSETDKVSSNTTREEWIFNDVYLGRYQSYSDSKLVFYTDFKWSVDNGIYTIIYGDPQVQDITVSMQKAKQPEILTLENGSVFATRE